MNLHVKVTLTEEMLGMMANDPKIHENFIASKAPDAASREEEIEAMGVEEVVEKGKTVFPRLPDGTPFMWDYQLKGFFKDAVGMLRRDPSNHSAKLKNYKKVIDGCLFVHPIGPKYITTEDGVKKRNRKIPIIEFVPQHDEDFTGNCQRPLRAQTMQGERVALSNSDAVPAGSTLEFVVEYATGDMEAWVRECLDYAEERGFGQWRNSGKGTGLWQELDDNGNVIGGNMPE